MKIPLLLLAFLGVSFVSCFSKNRKLKLRETVREMFYHGYDNYMKHAFPLDELSPLECTGKGRDHKNHLNYNINDVLGEYCLTLVDSMDTLLILGDVEGFKNAVDLVIKHVNFTRSSNTVQVFESNIRVLGGLLSSHLLLTHVYKDSFVGYTYDNGLLNLATDLGSRLLLAFENTETGIPFPRVNLVTGVPPDETNETCTAGAGSLILEFGVLSRLTGDERYEKVAKIAFDKIWSLRSPINLIGNVINIQTGEWIQSDSGIGAGIDSFFEYLLKAYVIFGDRSYLQNFETAYEAIMKHVLDPDGYIYRRVNMMNGSPVAGWVDSLGAFFPGLQVLYGDLPNAVRGWEFYYSLWKKYHALPERWDYQRKSVQIANYPLRPELIESTYSLYLATGDSYYLQAGEQFIEDLQKYSRKICGFATIDDVLTKSSIDRMESFFLSETLKYLYLLFDEDNLLNRMDNSYVFSTEAHPLFLPKQDLKPALDRTCFKLNYPEPLNSHPLSDLELMNIQAIAGLLSENHSNKCYASKSRKRKKKDNPEMFTVHTKDSFKGKFAEEDFNMWKFNDLYLVNHLHNVQLSFMITPNGNAQINAINSGVISPDAHVFVRRDKVLVAKNDSIYEHFENYDPCLVRIFESNDINTVVDESFHQLQAPSINTYLDIYAIPAAFGYHMNASLISSKNSTFLSYPFETNIVYFEDNHIGCKSFNKKEKMKISGSILVVYRGDCMFIEKALNAKQSGAIGLIVINSSGDALRMTGSKEYKTQRNEVETMLTVMISHESGVELVKRIQRDGFVPGAVFPLEWTKFGPNLVLNPSIFSNRGLMSFRDIGVDNLVLIDEREYEFLKLVATEQLIRKPTRKFLKSGMRWKCLNQCILKQDVCCS